MDIILSLELECVIVLDVHQRGALVERVLWVRLVEQVLERRDIRRKSRRRRVVLLEDVQADTTLRRLSQIRMPNASQDFDSRPLVRPIVGDGEFKVELCVPVEPLHDLDAENEVLDVVRSVGTKDLTHSLEVVKVLEVLLKANLAGIGLMRVTSTCHFFGPRGAPRDVNEILMFSVMSLREQSDHVEFMCHNLYYDKFCFLYYIYIYIFLMNENNFPQNRI